MEFYLLDLHIHTSTKLPLHMALSHPINQMQPSPLSQCSRRAPVTTICGKILLSSTLGCVSGSASQQTALKSQLCHRSHKHNQKSHYTQTPRGEGQGDNGSPHSLCQSFHSCCEGFFCCSHCWGLAQEQPQAPQRAWERQSGVRASPCAPPAGLVPPLCPSGSL